MKENLLKARKSFICKSCEADRPITDGVNADLDLDISNGVSLEKVDVLCYLGDTLDAGRGCDLTVMARVRSAWNKFCECLPIVIDKGFSLILKDKVYAT